MKPSLETLPAEMVSHIVTFLTLEDILSLRLANGALANKISPRILVKPFGSMNVELATEPLKNMIYITSHGRSGTFLLHCTIVGSIDSRITCTSNFDEHVRLLTEEFINLKQHSPRRNSQFVWETAQRTFNIVMTALRESQLTINSHLILFGRLKKSSLIYNALLPLDQRFNSLERLTMSLCGPYTAPQNRTSQGTHGTLLLQNFVNMLSLIPNLKEFDIHWYNVYSRSAIWPEIHETHTVAAKCHKTNRLEHCIIRGWHVLGPQLLEFLKAIQPEKLSLFHVRLVSETWAPIFDYLTSSDSRTVFCKLDDLFEGDQHLVHFDVPGRSKFNYVGAKMGPSTLTTLPKSQDEVKDGIRYNITPKHPFGAAHSCWKQSNMLEYGPR
ncbi:hypothetical protein F4678DRAFT_469942 [Xylaria arbuscula]|nr:hypothetical protein F4678DRAFT_469942 [Xylaria arbuscula]